LVGIEQGKNTTMRGFEERPFSWLSLSALAIWFSVEGAVNPLQQVSLHFFF